jgi:hypothetical protein
VVFSFPIILGKITPGRKLPSFFFWDSIARGTVNIHSKTYENGWATGGAISGRGLIKESLNM